MNPYIHNVNRLEFSVTLACTGKCRHCSQGDHTNGSDHLDGELAAEIVRKVCAAFSIQSLMTFGGEPLLYPADICKIHAEAARLGVPKRQVITNGYFSKDSSVIREMADLLAASGVNELLLSVDAFHQETIPLNPVKAFAAAVKAADISIKTQPAWLVGKEDNNPYNEKTKAILAEFTPMGIEENSGNIIFPSGNALKYFSEYFTEESLPENPYEEDPKDLHTISISPNGETLGGNVYCTDILTLIREYRPS